MSVPSIFGGVPIIENPDLLIGPFEDWSDVRSPSRAERRRRRGFPQRIRLYYKPDPSVYQIAGKYVMHPVTARQLRERIEQENANATR